MKSGKCPKCDSHEVYKRKSANHVMVWVSWLSYVHPYNYVCADCGHVEWYIEDRNMLETIRQKWERAVEKRKRKDW